MASDAEESEKGGVPESLRSAVERTLSATAGTAAETAERAQELLDEVARRGQGARDEVAKRGQEARDEVARRGRRTREDLSGMRFASAREVSELNERLERIESRLEALQIALETQTKSRPEG